MTDNHLYQLAQVISDLSPRSSPTLPPLEQRHDQRILPLRKNYAIDCICEEVQPRRGKNLPEGGLDSRAKKLNPTDKDDYDFTMKWLQENAHAIYRDNTNKVVGLSNQTEVGLCKAHSSTLYRAKKRRERDNYTSSPPSPPDYIDTPMDLTAPSGGLAAKVKELSQQQQRLSPQQLPSPLPSDFMMGPSTSYKRKRTNNNTASKMSSPPLASIKPPHSSASTPLYGTGPLLQQHPTSISSPPSSYLVPQLPPLQQQQQQHVQQQQSSNTSPTSPLPPMHPPPIQIETVSLKSMPSDEPCIYFIRNLAITDTFTFRHLLDETDITSSPPPPGKRIIIADPTSERIFPLSQAIRSVLPHPISSHMEFCLGLTDKTSVDWNSHT
ncbi:uncharacterized protein BX664DRAFT_268955 [Halteromyces radiatus]|uniref:uncharacterized protein n=1 Tax=Halteromyces radiatus TaxID=101107 RepID=UPI0022205D9B|nr:uncharacterized protein BX664DRAFT_268955 [Halteromyces radiatus]KAI8081427.1 hypothetical protein BX664DRAFT_268955 [Halteromyces radiatus]